MRPAAGKQAGWGRSHKGAKLPTALPFGQVVDATPGQGADNLHRFANVSLAIDFFDIMVFKPDAAMGHRAANSLGRVRSVNPVDAEDTVGGGHAIEFHPPRAKRASGRAGVRLLDGDPKLTRRSRRVWLADGDLILADDLAVPHYLQSALRQIDHNSGIVCRATGPCRAPHAVRSESRKRQYWYANPPDSRSNRHHHPPRGSQGANSRCRCRFGGCARVDARILRAEAALEISQP
jgi:hypothetical protein